MSRPAAVTCLLLCLLVLASCGHAAATQVVLQPTGTPAATASAPPDPTRTSTPAATPLPPTPQSPTATAMPPTVPPTLTPAAVPSMAPVEVQTRTRPQDGAVMVLVPEGTFSMGSADRPAGAMPDEKPQHAIYLDAFWIDQAEVTVAQFRAFVLDSGYLTTAEKQGWAYARVEGSGEWQKVAGAGWQHPSGPGSSAGDTHPVVQVSWFDAAAYCAWAGAGLPTEAQWEKAARGTDARIYPWGNEFDGARVNYCDASCAGGDLAFDDGYATTAPVGSYPAGAGPYGALDMAGNVWEWTAERYDAGYYDRSPSENPTGPPTGYSRVLRGGSWNHDRSGMRTACRLESPPASTVDNFGFRCAMP
jgi:eukaryotic-like serine/threonine-protein kinase